MRENKLKQRNLHLSVVSINTVVLHSQKNKMRPSPGKTSLHFFTKYNIKFSLFPGSFFSTRIKKSVILKLQTCFIRSHCINFKSILH